MSFKNLGASYTRVRLIRRQIRYFNSTANERNEMKCTLTLTPRSSLSMISCLISIVIILRLCPHAFFSLTFLALMFDCPKLTIYARNIQNTAAKDGTMAASRLVVVVVVRQSRGRQANVCSCCELSFAH